jgi:1,2-diacylglycerol 3-beta-galactosyltransferase
MKKVLFLLSDTGNGHRAAAEAIGTALKIKHGDSVHYDLVDVFKSYTPFPFRTFPEFYPLMVKYSSKLYGMSFNMSNTPRRANLLSWGMYTISQLHLRKITQDYTPDVIVSTHSIITKPVLTAFSRLPQAPPFVTVVVDLVSTHMLWYDNRSDMTLLPTEIAYRKAIEAGLNPQQMILTGPPVNPHFLENITDKASARHELGWDPHLPTILLTGGGDGMGKLYTIARAINESRIGCQLAIITGRNQQLRKELELCQWNQPTHVYGFVHNMYLMMSAADILVTKAGSLTISEACIAGLPMLLYEAIPGQEDGNLTYVVEQQIGKYAPSLRTIVRRIKEWIVDSPLLLEECAIRARLASKPGAVWEIANTIWNQAHNRSKGEIPLTL